MYIQILYRSIAEFADFDPSDLAILRSSIRNNAVEGITGYLLRADNQFVQALHGPMDAISRLVDRLHGDTRHRDIDLLWESMTEQSSPFEEWTMGYDLMLAGELGLDMVDGVRPEIAPRDGEGIFSRMVGAAQSAMDFGSGFPFARQPGESNSSYLDRLESVK